MSARTCSCSAASIRDNIALGKPDASEAEIIAAAKAAHAHDFIMRFPHGYDTPVGEHGMQLSGGERQRIAIARALIKDAPIILLDEATAVARFRIRAAVQEAMAQLCEGRTTIAIAHRLHTIMHADRILVIENGAVVESGRHDELLRKGGRYASFYRLQIQGRAGAGRADRIARAESKPLTCKSMCYPSRGFTCHSHLQPKSQHEQRQAYVIPPAPQAALAVAGSDRPVSGAPHLVRRPQLSGAHQGDGPGRARAAVLLRQARRRASCPTAAPRPIRR